MKHIKKRKFIIAAIVFCAGLFIVEIYKERPDLFRFKTEMEKKYPVCVLGVSEPGGAVSPGKSGLTNIYINWKTSFPAARVSAIRRAGAVPVITWEPYLENIKRDDLLPGIAAGKYDAYIARFARESAGQPVFIRFAHEPNSDWYGWSGVRSGTETYISAFRRVREFFAKKNSSAKFIFCVNVNDVPGESWNRFENYYPGDNNVDIIGIDAYNWGLGPKDWNKWTEPPQMLRYAYERIVKAFPSKPIFLTETAACEAGGNKAVWIEALLTALKNRFPAIKAVIWFNFKKECDWRLSTSELKQTFYGACGNGHIECDGKSLDWIFKVKS